MKIIIEPEIVNEKDSLVHALDAEKMVIYVEGALYGQMHAEFLGHTRGKTIKTMSKIGAVGGVLLGGPIGIALILTGAIGGTMGSKMDKLKQYDINIDTVRDRIVLIKSKGNNKYNKRKHQIARADP